MFLFLFFLALFFLAARTQSGQWCEGAKMETQICRNVVKAQMHNALAARDWDLCKTLYQEHPWVANAPFQHSLGNHGYRKASTVFQAVATGLVDGVRTRELESLTELMLPSANLSISNSDGLNVLHMTSNPRTYKTFLHILRGANTQVMDKASIFGTPLTLLVSKDAGRGKNE